VQLHQLHRPQTTTRAHVLARACALRRDEKSRDAKRTNPDVKRDDSGLKKD